ncbi:hypothetical protein CAL7716_068100 [Calothrix sp. PCC 7716]|nr:hypothetical protein CAL7716_068100 [Calothrix sp. PCC 7716]
MGRICFIVLESLASAKIEELIAEGRSGNITINTGSFSLLDNATIDTATQGIGNAGNLFIQAKDLANFDNGDISSIVEPQGMYQLPNGKIFMGNECSET